MEKDFSHWKTSFFVASDYEAPSLLSMPSFHIYYLVSVLTASPRGSGMSLSYRGAEPDRSPAPTQCSAFFTFHALDNHYDRAIMPGQSKLPIEGEYWMKSGSTLIVPVLTLAIAGLACISPLDQGQNEIEIESSSSSPAAEDKSSVIELPPADDEAQYEIAPIIRAGLWNPANLTSYRSDYVITFDGVSGGENIQGSMSFLMEITTDPPAQHILMDFEGYDFGAESPTNIELYVLDDTLYANMGIEQGWILLPGAGFAAMREGLFLPEEMIDLPAEARRSLLPETVNGVISWHYRIDESNFQADSTVYDSMLADAWVAVDGGYLVKMDATFSGSFLESGGQGSFLDEGTIQFIFNLLDVNQGFRIELPAAALQAGDFALDDLISIGEWSREDIPLPTDAIIAFSTPQLVEAETALSVEAARDFMVAQLQANAWLQEGEPYGDTDSYFANYYKGDEALSLAINNVDQRTSIFIILE